MLNADQLSRVDLNLLILFHAVAQEGHVGRAATRMNLTPSAVSHGLRRLRELFNDPLFLRTPKGVVPTERAMQLQPAVQAFVDVALRALENAAPFDAATSRRRFVIGAPDAVLAAMVVPLMERLAAVAPQVDVGLVHVMPVFAADVGDPWVNGLNQLERRELDLAALPTQAVPLRFRAQRLYDEEFVLAMRQGHPLAGGASLEDFVACRHLLVSMSASPRGFVDNELAELGLKRRVAMTVPTFSMAPQVLADTDLVAALPRRFAEQQAARAGLAIMPLPVAQGAGMGPIQLVATQVALADQGVAWLFNEIQALYRDPA